jgi:hypothetical protein
VRLTGKFLQSTGQQALRLARGLLVAYGGKTASVAS